MFGSQNSYGGYNSNSYGNASYYPPPSNQSTTQSNSNDSFWGQQGQHPNQQQHHDRMNNSYRNQNPALSSDSLYGYSTDNQYNSEQRHIDGGIDNLESKVSGLSIEQSREDFPVPSFASSLGSKKSTSWASIASQPAKSQPKLLKSKFAASGLTGSTSKHLPPTVTMDAMSWDSKASNGSFGVSKSQPPPPSTPPSSSVINTNQSTANSQSSMVANHSPGSSIDDPSLPSSGHSYPHLHQSLQQPPQTSPPLRSGGRDGNGGPWGSNGNSSSSSGSPRPAPPSSMPGRAINNNGSSGGGNGGDRTSALNNSGGHHQPNNHYNNNHHQHQPSQQQQHYLSNKGGYVNDGEINENFNPNKFSNSRPINSHYQQQQSHHNSYHNHQTQNNNNYSKPIADNQPPSQPLPPQQSQQQQPPPPPQQQQQSTTSFNNVRNVAPYSSASSRTIVDARERDNNVVPRPSSIASDDSETHAAVLRKLAVENNYNPPEFDLNPRNARFFIIKSYSEDDVHRSIKYSIWCSTDHGNKRLDTAFRQQEGKGPIYLFYSVNRSGHFCGIAQMMSPVDYNASAGVWAQDKWKGQFQVKWIYVKDVPNDELRHITLENNENKPVTNSRDTQEVPYEKGKKVLSIIHRFEHRTSIFDDFLHYEKKQEEELVQRRPDSPPPTHYGPSYGPPKNSGGPYPGRDGSSMPYRGDNSFEGKHRGSYGDGRRGGDYGRNDYGRNEYRSERGNDYGRNQDRNYDRMRGGDHMSGRNEYQGRDYRDQPPPQPFQRDHHYRDYHQPPPSREYGSRGEYGGGGGRPIAERDGRDFREHRDQRNDYRERNNQQSWRN